MRNLRIGNYLILRSPGLGNKYYIRRGINMRGKKLKIEAQGHEISVLAYENQDDFISLTDIAKQRNKDAPADIIKNWLRSRSTIEYLGLWERLY